jgi:hypothetical protein
VSFAKIVSLNKEEMIKKFKSGFFAGMKPCAYNPADNSFKVVQL